MADLPSDLDTRQEPWTWKQKLFAGCLVGFSVALLVFAVSRAIQSEKERERGYTKRTIDLAELSHEVEQIKARLGSDNELSHSNPSVNPPAYYSHLFAKARGEPDSVMYLLGELDRRLEELEQRVRSLERNEFAR